MKIKTKILILVVLLISLSFVFEGKTNNSSIHSQWAKSPHAESMNTEAERIRMNKAGCAHCHTAQGYWEVILGGKESTAPYKNATGITCETCHFPDKNIFKGPLLRAGNIKNACTGCHDIIVQNSPEDFSSCPQGSLLKGIGGAEFEGKSYPKSTHAKIKKNCAGCHMAKSMEGDNFSLVGEHTFRVISKGEKPGIFNKNGCVKCHEDISVEFVLENQARTKNLLNTLAALLPQKAKKNPEKPEENPKFPQDPSLNRIQAMASFNYYQILKDGTLGIHNPIYIKKLLKDSILALQNQISAKEKTDSSS